MVNSLENFKYVFDKALEGKFIDRMDQNEEIFARYINDQEFAKLVAESLRKQVYEQIRAEAKEVAANRPNGRDYLCPRQHSFGTTHEETHKLELGSSHRN